MFIYPSKEKKILFGQRNALSYLDLEHLLYQITFQNDAEVVQVIVQITKIRCIKVFTQ